MNQSPAKPNSKEHATEMERKQQRREDVPGKQTENGPVVRKNHNKKRRRRREMERKISGDFDEREWQIYRIKEECERFLPKDRLQSSKAFYL